MTGSPRSGLGDAVRLALGTLTVLPVRAPVVDRVSAGRAMVLAPVVGLLLAVPAGLLVWLGTEAGLSPVLTAALVVGLLALLTRGMHLDGLADTADGLAAGRRDRGRALEVMRQGPVGPLGACALVL
ncbi:MAG: adenosylcobinamide-GDP ribazoletransferase, partial [Nocardioides sp.]